VFGIICLALYQQFIAMEFVNTNIIYDMEYSRYFVIIFIALVFLAAFICVCDRASFRVADEETPRKK
jgi:hypothetical protein